MGEREYGKFLKHLRINNEEMLQDMAQKLDIKSSYLSAIESDHRDVPVDLTEKISKVYNLSEEDRQRLHQAELERDRKAVQLDLEKIKDNVLAKETVLSFANRFSSLTDEQLSAIQDILNKKEEVCYRIDCEK